jgi:hypothetical protein
VTDANPTRYFKRAEEIVPIVQERGHCLATKRITVDGARVSYLYREDPGSPTDSGWVFLAGDESREYFADTANMELYDVNTIANYDREIIQFLDHPVGCAYDRAPSGAWRTLKTPHGKPIDTVTKPDVQGRVVIANAWSIELQERFSRRLEGEGVEILWHRGLTFFCSASRIREPEKAVREMLAGRPPNATHFADERTHGVRRISYRVPEPEDARVIPSMVAVASAAEHLLILQAKFDEELTFSKARSVWNSVMRELPV